MAMTHMSQDTLQGVITSTVLEARFSLVSTMPVGDWARVSTPAKHFFQYISLLQIGTKILCSMLSYALVNSQLVCKCQTLTYVKSCRYVGLSGHSSPQKLANIFPIVCAVLALNSWNYCSGQQDPTAQHPLIQYFPKWFY